MWEYTGGLTSDAAVAATEQQSEASEDIYTINAAKHRKYDDDLFPVEAKIFGYDPNAKAKSVNYSLDDRVKKKADRYCK
ncbi:hypothetical protein CQW23_08091 [Capsicum baccatum]|uniref:Uncharacterized protein n=1 Tax=Capsicum baccatum TaxID=33114 RepID=A0A2G2X863_CAPBA|nr:hypothetical protein CQW23_08091 [Capsicum baccatum]